MFIALISPGPFMSYTNDINNFGKYDKIIASALETESISKVLNTHNNFTCTEFDYTYSHSMLYDAYIKYTLKLDGESFENEKRRLIHLMKYKDTSTYNIKFDSWDDISADYANITVTFDEVNHTIKYNISVGW